MTRRIYLYENGAMGEVTWPSLTADTRLIRRSPSRRSRRHLERRTLRHQVAS